MNFKAVIRVTGKIYNFLEKFNLDNNIKIDEYLYNNHPAIVARLQTCVKDKKIAYCATNGKHTAVNMINQILEADSKTYISNITKYGKRYPIYTSIILDLARMMNIFEQDYEKDYYIMALDEFDVAGYFNSMKFNYLVLNNILDDQKDFCSLNEKKKKIQNAIMLNSKLNLIINADDPMYYKIDEIKDDTAQNSKRNKFYYGFDEIELSDNTKDLAQKTDIIRCPNCGCMLEYNKRFYSHLGYYNCSCGFRRPKLNLSAKAKIYSDYIFLTAFYEDNKMVFKLPFGGIDNAYNALSAIALAINLNIDRKTISLAFENYKTQPARDEIIKYKDKRIKIKLIKNPTSLSCALESLYGAKNIKPVFCLNNDMKDGFDTSWIWDANFNALSEFENKVFVCGQRFDDMALRLKYANVNPCLITMDNSVKSAIKCCFYELEKKEEMLIFTVPSLIDEIYATFET